jgi:hypothetical protein
MSKPTIPQMTVSPVSADDLNTSLAVIQDALDDSLSRSGNLPNSMEADLDMNSNNILNVERIELNSFCIDGLCWESFNDFRASVSGEAIADQAAAAEAAAAAAALSEELARKWATEDENVPVSTLPDEFSAYHWSQKAKDFASGAAGAISYDNLTSGLTATDVQAAIDELAAGVAGFEIPNVVPVGGIILWSGSVASIPADWALCDGTNGTPDLRNRFVVGAGSTYAVDETGEGSIPEHSHDAGDMQTNNTGSHSHSGSTSTTGNHNHSYTYAPIGTISVVGGSAVVKAPGNPGTYTTGSNGNHSHSITINSAGSHAHTVAGTTGVAGTGSSVIARYYALAYIMKVA